MSIGPKLRFAILQRDGFTCRYCGARAPEVELHVDHVVARANGGKDVASNLVTACRDCNLGKSATILRRHWDLIADHALAGEVAEEVIVHFSGRVDAMGLWIVMQCQHPALLDMVRNFDDFEDLLSWVQSTGSDGIVGATLQ